MAEAPSFANSDQVKAWLDSQPVDIAQAFAARAALRSIPYLPGQVSGGSATRSEVGSLILLSFRAVSAAWAVGAFPSGKEKLGEVAAAAVVALETLVPFKTAASETAAAAALASSSKSSQARVRFACITALQAAHRAAGGTGRSEE